MLYTRKGDDGNTSFFGECGRFSKSVPRADALGAVDEINSLLGVCKELARKKNLALKNDEEVSKIINEVQKNLFIVQSEIGGAENTISADKVKEMEKVIREIEKELPQIREFKIAGGSVEAASLDFARAIARRTEREIIRASEEKEIKIGENSKKYLNRLSSLLFALARLANAKSGIAEESPSYE